MFFPVEADGKLSSTSKSTPLKFPFVYENKNAPNPERQDEPHPHQVVEGADQELFVADLGGDRIWVVKRQGLDELSIKGYFQCPGGSGPRHCVTSADGTLGSDVWI